MRSGWDPQLQKARKRLCGGPFPDHLHNKGIPRPSSPSRPAAARPRHISRLTPQAARASPGFHPRPQRFSERVIRRPPPASFSSTRRARPSSRRGPAPQTLTTARFPGGAEPLPSGPSTPQIRRAPPAFRAFGEALTAPGRRDRPNPSRNPPRGPSCPTSPPATGLALSSPPQDSLPSRGSDTRSWGTPGPRPDQQAPQLRALRIPHTEYRVFTSPPPYLHPWPPRGLPPAHLGPEPCRGLSFKNLVPYLSRGLSTHWGRLPIAKVLPCTNLRPPRSKPSAQSPPRFPPAPASAPFPLSRATRFSSSGSFPSP